MESENSDNAKPTNLDPVFVSGALVTSIQSSITAAVFFGIATVIILMLEVYKWGVTDLYLIFILGFSICTYGTYKKNKLFAISLLVLGVVLFLLKLAMGLMAPLTMVVSVVTLYYFLQGAIGVHRMQIASNKSSNLTGEKDSPSS